MYLVMRLNLITLDMEHVAMYDTLTPCWKHIPRPTKAGNYRYFIFTEDFVMIYPSNKHVDD